MSREYSLEVLREVLRVLSCEVSREYNKHLGLRVRFREEYRVSCGVKFPLACRHVQNLKREKQLAPQN